MGFQQSGFFAGIDEHTFEDRDPPLPVGQHKLKIKQCIRDITFKKKLPRAQILVELLESNNPEARIGDTYGMVFFRTPDTESYFFRDIKRFMGAVLKVKAEDIGSDHVEDAFVDGEDAKDNHEVTPLVGSLLRAIVEIGPYTNKKGVTYDKTTYDFRGVFDDDHASDNDGAH